jgi:hypothetical protein
VSLEIVVPLAPGRAPCRFSHEARLGKLLEPGKTRSWTLADAWSGVSASVTLDAHFFAALGRGDVTAIDEAEGRRCAAREGYRPARELRLPSGRRPAFCLYGAGVRGDPRYSSDARRLTHSVAPRTSPNKPVGQQVHASATLAGFRRMEGAARSRGRGARAGRGAPGADGGTRPEPSSPAWKNRRTRSLVRERAARAVARIDRFLRERGRPGEPARGGSAPDAGAESPPAPPSGDAGGSRDGRGGGDGRAAAAPPRAIAGRAGSPPGPPPPDETRLFLRGFRDAPPQPDRADDYEDECRSWYGWPRWAARAPVPFAAYTDFTCSRAKVDWTNVVC